MSSQRGRKKGDGSALRKRILFEFSNRKRARDKQKKIIQQEPPCHPFPMCGYYVNLPEGVTPYRSQKMMIVKILTALKAKQNVMIESPTGSGKTLGLLASTCAWLLKYIEERAESLNKCEVHGDAEHRKLSVPPGANSGVEVPEEIPTQSDTMSRILNARPIPNDPSTCDDLDDFAISPLKKRCRSQEDDDCVILESSFDNSRLNVSIARDAELEFEHDLSTMSTSRRAAVISVMAQTQDSAADSGFESQKEKQLECSCKPKVRLYYCSRTHKQITQVIKEFARLSYGYKLKHTILASREQLCVNETVRGMPDMTSKCKELITDESGPGCRFKNAMKQKFSQSGPKQAGQMRELIGREVSTVWDVEDLKVALTENPVGAMCPYFSSTRLLTVDADVVFCPFSYLIDPIIRESSDVHPGNSIVILDEAHNVEDFSRDAATFLFTDKEIIDSYASYNEKYGDLVQQISSISTDSRRMEVLYQQEKERYDDVRETEAALKAHLVYMEIMRDYANRMYAWLSEIADPAVEKLHRQPYGRGEQKASHNCSYADLYTSLEDHGLLLLPGDPKTEKILKAYKLVAAAGREDGDEEQQSNFLLASSKPKGEAIVCVEKLLHFMTFFTPTDNKTAYRLNVTIEKNFSRNDGGFERVISGAGPKNVGYSQSFSFDDRGQHDSGGKAVMVEGYRTTIGLWCMSPALAFNGALSKCHSVVLASGTLTPADTFESELKMEFKFKMEGDQVIPSERIFACIVNKGKRGERLIANYQNTSGNDNTFVSGLCDIILTVCERTPGGVLVFFPSYRLMESVRQFVLSGDGRIIRRKHLLSEPRRSSELNAVMLKFEEAIRNPKKYGHDCTGAVIFAVFRGKISEGIDFADDLARCVISVGIPFPNAYDDLVLEKKKYNNENSKSQNLLTGDAWYTTQAYRALNQALGRCLRHRNDWGALVLVDDRLMPQMNPNNPNRISKWIRKQLRNFPSYAQFENEYEAFVERMQAEAADEENRSSVPVGELITAD